MKDEQRKSDGLNFQEAIQAVADGFFVARAGWKDRLGFAGIIDHKYLLEITRRGRRLTMRWADFHKDVTAEDWMILKNPPPLFEVYVSRLSFEEALNALRCKFRVAREEWKENGSWLDLQGQEVLSETPSCIHINHLVDAKTTQARRVPWLASQADILAEDWVILQGSPQ